MEAWISQDSTPTYMLRVERALEEEKQRVAAYLNSETEAKLLQVRVCCLSRDFLFFIFSKPCLMLTHDDLNPYLLLL